MSGVAVRFNLYQAIVALTTFPTPTTLSASLALNQILFDNIAGVVRFGWMASVASQESSSHYNTYKDLAGDACPGTQWIEF